MPSLMKRTACAAVDTHHPHYLSIVAATMNRRGDAPYHHHYQQHQREESCAHNFDLAVVDEDFSGSSGYHHHQQHQYQDQQRQHQHHRHSTSCPPTPLHPQERHQRWRSTSCDYYVSSSNENSHPVPLRPSYYHRRQHQQFEDDHERLVPTYYRMRSNGASIMEEATTNARKGPSGGDRMVADPGAPQPSSRVVGSGLSSRDVEYQTTSDGDVVVVQPSFEETGDPKAGPPSNGKEWTRAQEDREGRNPSPRRAVPPGHSRNLSAHFYDATSLDDRDPGQGVNVKDDDASSSGSSGGERKHRRIFSGDLSNPNFAHRRLNSTGLSTAVRRGRDHHRVDSAGLDMLSAVADATKDELASAAGGSGAGTTAAPWEQRQESRPSIGQVSTGSYEQPPPPTSSMMQHGMHPPPPNPGPSQSSMSSYPGPPPPPHYMPSQPPPPTTGASPHAHYPPSHQYPMYYYGPPPPAYHHHRVPSHGGYPVQAARPPLEGHARTESALSSEPRSELDKKHQQAQTRPNHQGSQTFVTAIAVGQGSKTLQASTSAKNAATSTDDINVGAASSVPSHVGHHRKMSSFSSIGTLLGSSLFSPGGGGGSGGDDNQGHHRHTSSTMSFLAGFEGLEGVGPDDAFLRNLQASNPDFQQQQQPPSAHPQQKAQPPAAPASSSQARRASPAAQPTAAISSNASAGSKDSSNNSYEIGDRKGGTKLAAGGTSKRVRRKCTVEGCPNRVVQGGLCISHGAKRKQCKHPGCTKNVKKAGLCSTHGPARKRCDYEGCGKVAVQGGRCIAHGAKKKLCSVDGCSKQAILAGMCKKHHDQKNASGGSSKAAGVQYCQEVAPRSAAAQAKHKAHHTRGLSIFQDLSADVVSDLLNEGQY